MSSLFSFGGYSKEDLEELETLRKKNPTQAVLKVNMDKHAIAKVRAQRREWACMKLLKELEADQAKKIKKDRIEKETTEIVRRTVKEVLELVKRIYSED